MANISLAPEVAAKHQQLRQLQVTARPEPPPLFGYLAELDVMQRSNAWAIGRALTRPIRLFSGYFDDALRATIIERIGQACVLEPDAQLKLYFSSQVSCLSTNRPYRLARHDRGARRCAFIT